MKIAFLQALACDSYETSKDAKLFWFRKTHGVNCA
jgi:hypothetical protein